MSVLPWTKHDSGVVQSKLRASDAAYLTQCNKHKDRIDFYSSVAFRQGHIAHFRHILNRPGHRVEGNDHLLSDST